MSIIVLSVADAFAGMVTPRVIDVPTLSEWGMIATAGGLMLAGVFFAVYRKRAAKV